MEQPKYINQKQVDNLMKICAEAGLSNDDFFMKPMVVRESDKSVKGYNLMIIVKRQGISKLQDKFKVSVEVVEKNIERYVYKDQAGKEYTGWDVWMFGRGKISKGNDKKEVWSFSSANHKNCSNEYLIETCEKRLKSRIVLELADLYQHGIFGEDESSDFEENTSLAKGLEKKLETTNPRLGQPSK